MQIQKNKVMSCQISNKIPTDNFDSNPIVDYLEKIKIPIRLALINKNGYPIVVSLWFKISDGKILCATKPTAKIVQYFSKNNLCGFEISSDKPPYRGMRGSGICKINHKNGKEVLETLILKYLGEGDSKLKHFLLEKADKEISLEIMPQKIFHFDYTQRMTGISL
jgi:hypothetical protein